MGGAPDPPPWHWGGGGLDPPPPLPLYKINAQYPAHPRGVHYPPPNQTPEHTLVGLLTDSRLRQGGFGPYVCGVC